MFWISLILVVIFILLLGGKDATSYLLREVKDPYKGITKIRLDRWHRDGVLIHSLYTFTLAWATGLWVVVPLQTLLVRLAVYDIVFNKWASLPFTYIGETSRVDRFFRKVFGTQGAIKKLIVFLLILIAWGTIKTFI
jgi:hypothetical protein